MQSQYFFASGNDIRYYAFVTTEELNAAEDLDSIVGSNRFGVSLTTLRHIYAQEERSKQPRHHYIVKPAGAAVTCDRESEHDVHIEGFKVCLVV